MSQESPTPIAINSIDDLEARFESTRQQWDKFTLSKMPVSGGRILKESWNPEDMIKGWSKHLKGKRMGLEISSLASGAVISAVAVAGVIALPVGLLGAAAFIGGSFAISRTVHKDPTQDFEKIREVQPRMKAQYLELLEQTRELAALQATQPDAARKIEQTLAAFEKFTEKAFGTSTKQLEKFERDNFEVPEEHVDLTALKMASSLRKELRAAADDPASYARTRPIIGRPLARDMGPDLGPNLGPDLNTGTPSGPDIEPPTPDFGR